MTDLIARQIEMEEEARRRHRQGWLDNINDAIADGRAGSVPLLHRMMVEAFPKVEAGMLAIFADQSRGYGAQYRTLMRELGAKECASLAISMAVSSAAAEQTVVAALKGMGQAVVAEVVYKRAAAAGEVQAAYMDRVRMDNRKARSKDPQHIMAKVRKSATNVGQDPLLLPQRAFITIGKLMMQTIADTGLVVTERRGGSSSMRGAAHFVLHEDVLTTLKDWMELPRVDGGCYPPMIVPPVQISEDGRSGMWQSPGQRESYRVISRMNRREYRQLRIDPTPVVEPCMALSSVPYRINPMVLELLQRTRTGCLGLPSEPVQPKLPFTIPAGVTFAQYISKFPEEMQQQMDAEAHEFKVRTRIFHTNMRKFMSQMLALNAAVNEAQRYVEFDKVYLPTYADTRGRIYYSSTLNPQGIDAIRALLELAEPVPLGPDGLYWLKVHIANSFGYDATDFDDRARWTEKTLPRLREACRIPEAYDSFWSEADSPITAWAASVELLRAIDSGNPSAYMCRVVTQWDATCSGLQHLSAMLRDEVGGAAVNLLDSPGRKADIYLKVANAALEGLRQSERVSPTALGAWLLSVGVPRAWAKKPVMTYVYGATKHGMIDYYCLMLRESRTPLPEGFKLMQCATFIANLMWDAIPKVVPAAAALMAWLQEIANTTGQEGEYVEFTAPSGLRVPNQYMKYKEMRVGLNLMGVHRVQIQEPTDKPDPRKCAAAFAPNFVHAMDASHMMRVLWALWNEGIYMVSIHDSFGCAAAHAGRMHQVIREQFVKLYEDFNPIQALATAYNREAPAMGNLDIRNVLKSSKFFC